MVYDCTICGRSFALEQQLKMHSTKHMNAGIRENPNLKESTPEPPKEKKDIVFKTGSINRDIEQKRAELEMLRIDNEIKRLTTSEAPDTRIDYYGKMLELQEKHNTQLLQMQKGQFDLQLDLERLKLGQEPTQDDFMGTLEMLKPFLPLIAEKMLNKAPKEQKTLAKVEKPTEPIKSTVPTKEQLEAYRKAIIDGTITEQDAYNNFVKENPLLAKKFTRKEFKARFEAIKENKKL
jgi:hypothetical protein